MMGKRTITLLALFLLAGGPYWSFAQQDEQASRSTPYRIGIFPCGGRFTGNVEQQIALVLQTNIQKDRGLTLTYSHYDDVLNEPRIKNRDRLWVGGAVRKKPNQEIVYGLARERGIDGVVMCWGKVPAQSPGAPNPKPASVEIYLVDVAERKVYRNKGTTKKSSMDKLTRKLVAQFLAGRPEVVLAKATLSAPTAVTPTPAPTKKVVTPAPTAAQVVPAATTPGDVILTRGTLVSVELTENINANINAVGETVNLKVAIDVVVDGEVVVPKGALVTARVGLAQKRKSLGKAGELQFFPVRVQTIDGQWVPLEKDNFGAKGRTRTGATIGHVIVWGPLGLLAKGRAGFVLRGTQYEVIVERDAVIDTGKRKPLASLRNADFQTTARFRAVTQKIKFSKGKSGRDFVLDITLTPDITLLVQQKPSAIEIVEILDYVLHKPIKPIKVVLNPKKNNFISATFSWWSIVKHAQPGYTPMTVQLKLSDGRLAQAQATLDSEWKLK